MAVHLLRRPVPPASEGAHDRLLVRAPLAIGLVAATALGYSLVSYELSLAGALPMPEPYLRIADQAYFYWGTYFYAPVIIAGWLIASAVMYVLAWWFGHRCRFDKLLINTAFATGLGILGTLVPDLVTSPLRALGVIDEQAWESAVLNHGSWFYFLWASMVLYAVIFLVAYPLAARYSAQLRKPQAAVTGVLGFAAFQGFLYIFIR